MFARLISILALPAILCVELADALHILPITSSERFRCLAPADALITTYTYAVYCVGVIMSIPMLFAGTQLLNWITAVFIAYFLVSILLRIVFECMLLVIKGLE